MIKLDFMKKKVTDSVNLVWIFIILCLLCFSPVFSQSGRIPVKAKQGMVVSAHYLASQVGRDILKKGGNAIDATVATAFALAVTYPSAGNIGGGGFLVYHSHDGKATSFNFREKAPLLSDSEMFLDDEGQIKGNIRHDFPLAVGVPGTVAGLYQAHQKLGKLKWSDLVEPAVKLAQNGIEITWDMQRFLIFLMDKRELYPSTAKAFLKNGKIPYEPGEIWKQKDLAETLKRIQAHGADGFYKGETARMFVEFMKKNGGLITLEDLNSYEAQELKPIHGQYRGYDVYGMPPPSSGGVAMVEMLNMLEGFNLNKMGHNSAIYLHVLTEAMRRAFADRALNLGDPLFNASMPIEKLTSKDHAEKLRSTIHLFKSSESDSSAFSSAFLPKESEETTHFSVMDAEGNAVSMTYTLQQAHGSKMVVEGAGFLLNNIMGDFNPIPGLTNSKGLIGTPPNTIEPGKRMLSSQSPTIVAKNGQPVMVIGSPGGRTIINTVLQVILNVIDHRMSISEAIEAPRIHHQWLPDISRFEKLGISPDTQKLYEMLGHKVAYTRSQGRAMGIYKDYDMNLLFGTADSRSPDGKAVGY